MPASAQARAWYAERTPLWQAAENFEPGVNGWIDDDLICSACHVTTGVWTDFGYDFWDAKDAVGQDSAWYAVHALDSDGDGLTNGQEIGDPCGLFEMGDALGSSIGPQRNTPISHPGLANNTVPLGSAGSGDEDGDLVCDVLDNCPSVPNPDQDDADGNDVGDACEEGAPVDDSGAPVGDAGSVDDDAGAPVEDAGSVDDDAGARSEDAGPVDDDAGPLIEDAGSLLDDAGASDVDDGGALPADAGEDEMPDDAGEPLDGDDAGESDHREDAGEPSVDDDAGEPTGADDAGEPGTVEQTDAGADGNVSANDAGDDDDVETGCRCVPAGSSAPISDWLFALLMIALPLRGRPSHRRREQSHS